MVSLSRRPSSSSKSTTSSKRYDQMKSAADALKGLKFITTPKSGEEGNDWNAVEKRVILVVWFYFAVCSVFGAVFRCRSLGLGLWFLSPFGFPCWIVVLASSFVFWFGGGCVAYGVGLICPCASSSCCSCLPGRHRKL
ncbi:hypothetical protein Dsin_014505 [Dipteronia sinensis]|uniref:Uncharacterized protein n=1 Tax=Dipteronia sinensis TaxID=43782 RepID=A0AAE0AMN2_9ROSI|nr:hypothetical protein Dsin_014505 [Dipteronia sinensis]